MGRWIRRHTAIAVAMLCGVALIGAPGLAGVARADSTSDVAMLVQDINGARAANGAGPLLVDPRLTSVALWWAGQMAAAGGISHSPALTQMAPPGWTALGENVGVGGSASVVSSAFMASPAHLANIVDPRFTAVGVGEVVANGELYVVEDFMAGGTAAVVHGVTADPLGAGYWMASTDGTVYAKGTAPFLGAPSGVPVRVPVIGVAATRSGHGYWLVDANGGIYAFGDAGFYGATGAMHLNAPIVGMAASPSGRGYWLIGSDGGIFAFGDAGFYGSTGAMRLNAPIVGMAPTASGRGYWLVASDGGIFTFGDAVFEGSTGAMHLNRPVVGMAPSAQGNGYWLVASDGGIFTFGAIAFYGSTGGTPLSHAITGMTATPSGAGYWLVESDGTVHPFGDAGTFA
jgi:hypothetical protein